MDFSESPTDPSGGGGWTLDFKKERIDILGGAHCEKQIMPKLPSQR